MIRSHCHKWVYTWGGEGQFLLPEFPQMSCGEGTNIIASPGYPLTLIWALADAIFCDYIICTDCLASFELQIWAHLPFCWAQVGIKNLSQELTGNVEKWVLGKGCVGSAALQGVLGHRWRRENQNHDLVEGAWMQQTTLGKMQLERSLMWH